MTKVAVARLVRSRHAPLARALVLRCCSTSWVLACTSRFTRSVVTVTAGARRSERRTCARRATARRLCTSVRSLRCTLIRAWRTARRSHSMARVIRRRALSRETLLSFWKRRAIHCSSARTWICIWRWRSIWMKLFVDLRRLLKH